MDSSNLSDEMQIALALDDYRNHIYAFNRRIAMIYINMAIDALPDQDDIDEDLDELRMNFLGSLFGVDFKTGEPTIKSPIELRDNFDEIAVSCLGLDGVSTLREFPADQRKRMKEEYITATENKLRETALDIVCDQIRFPADFRILINLVDGLSGPQLPYYQIMYGCSFWDEVYDFMTRHEYVTEWARERVEPLDDLQNNCHLGTPPCENWEIGAGWRIAYGHKIWFYVVYARKTSPTCSNCGPPQENVVFGDEVGESEPDSADVSECESYNASCDPDADIANTHESNEEFKKSDILMDFFTKIKDVNVEVVVKTLKDEATREWIGSLPSRWRDGIIPLFTYNETDYQLHISYTWMNVIDTSGYSMTGPRDDQRTVDFYAHALAWASGENSTEIVLQPLVIIPLGKLLNRLGHSSWAGYEVFVSDSLEVWMIYVPNDQDDMRWKTFNSGFPLPQGINNDQSKDTPAKQEPRYKLMRLCASLKHLRTATFEDIQPRHERSLFCTGSHYL
ncbi:hypothetical protein GQX73_g10789 [Xylaria multiplex]|uniref:Uncharacterized protein n=1 Tax=Xylaria multiplex TaxID=323545 RepID=A0A7C8IKM1_9PEZI|nr:hypothetical protein GQX73_g10789 [Xylaria multiplex]